MEFVPRFVTTALLGAAMLAQIPIAHAEEGEFAIDGTLDCGENTEEYCPIRDRVTLITSSLSGVKEPVVVRIDWIKDQWIDSLPLQDDYYMLQVFPRPNGGLRAIGILDHLTVPNLDSKRDPRDGRKQSDHRSDEQQQNQNKGNH